MLFLIFINDAPKLDKVDESIFADDKLTFTSSYRVSAIIKKLKKVLALNKKYFHKWKIKLNENKTEAILFTKRRPIVEQNIYSDELKIEWSEKVKYLGVVLDTKLTFANHIKHIIQKAISNLIKFYSIFKNSHISIHSKKIFYKNAHP